jgi:hypothetical protein
MPTFARKHQLAESLVYHVYHRSSNRMPLFHREDDYQRFRTLLEEYHERFAIKLYHRDFDSAQDRRFDAMEKPVGEFLRRLVQLNGRFVSCRRGNPRNINCATI